MRLVILCAATLLALIQPGEARAVKQRAGLMPLALVCESLGQVHQLFATVIRDGTHATVQAFNRINAEAQRRGKATQCKEEWLKPELKMKPLETYGAVPYPPQALYDVLIMRIVDRRGHVRYALVDRFVAIGYAI